MGLLEPEQSAGILTEKQAALLVAQAEVVESCQRPRIRHHWIVGSEEHLLLAPAFHVLHKLARVPVCRIGAGVDANVGVLVGDGDHLSRPRVADVTADDDQLGEVKRIGRPLIVSHEMIGRMLLKNLLDLPVEDALMTSQAHIVVRQVDPGLRRFTDLRPQ